MSRLPLRGRLKVVAADFWQLLNSPSTWKDLIVHPSLMKTLPFALLVALVGAAAVRSQDAPVDPTRESGAAPRAAYPAMPAAILPHHRPHSRGDSGRHAATACAAKAQVHHSKNCHSRSGHPPAGRARDHHPKNQTHGAATAT